MLPRVTLCSSCYREVADGLMTTLVRDCVIAEQRDPGKVSLEVSTLAAAWLDEDLEDARTEAFKRVLAGRHPEVAGVKDVSEDVFEDGWNTENVFRYIAIQNAFKAITPEGSGQEVCEGIICSRLVEWAVKPDSPHPLAPIIRAYLRRTPRAIRNNRPMAMVINEHFQIREHSPPTDVLSEVDVGQVMLPGLEALLPDYDEMERFPILAMFDAMQGSDKEAGLGLRLLVTVLSEIDVLESKPIGDNGVLVPMLLRTILRHLWPRETPRGKHRQRAIQRLRAAMFGWNLAGIPDRGGLRRVIGTVGEWIALPDDYPLDGEIFFQVYLPLGATRGALIHRETMDYLGVSSGLMYRAMLTLTHQWWRGAHTKGKNEDGVTRGTTWPYATRPIRRKDGAGNPIIRKGRTVPDDPNGEREPNPMIRYLPSYTDERILQLCYSPTQIEGAKRTGNLHKYQERAWAAARKMERIGLLEMGYYGDLKLCPPRGWGANFKMPEEVKTLGRRRKTV
ncbi:MAG: hypothetical protein F4Z82_00195 [Caldilineaceae bacterium SB0668_bin_21]|nr:hypothetical protein [Caldilineaceae bacterium SB0668_bin_21]MYC20381.1 hypothetical protein [Caldilineaceae bacterium SB0662_bin_25]